MTKYERAYNELAFDRTYSRVHGLREAVNGINGFVTHNDTQVKKVATEFSGGVIRRTAAGYNVTVSEYLVEMMVNWRSCKQIYDFDKVLYDELSVTPDDKIPTDILSKMPYPIFYIRCPHDETLSKVPAHVKETLGKGWRYSEHIHTDGALVSYIGGILVIRFYSTSTSTYTDQLTGKTVTQHSDGIYSWGNTYEVDGYQTIGDIMLNEVKADYYQSEKETDLSRKIIKKTLNGFVETGWGFNDEDEDVMHVLAAILYIVSKEADTESFYVPSHRGKRTNKDNGLSSAEVTRVGYRIGRALGETRRQVTRYTNDDESSGGRVVSAHIRRAHWHCYWTGPKDNPTDIVVHWLAPIVVNGDRGEMRPTVHMSNKGRC